MKVLGISFGRPMKNGELLVKHALMAAQEAGAGVKYINTLKMDIRHCTGCGACSRGRENGKQIRCIIKDDYSILEEAVLDADAIIVAAPVYVLGPVGQFKNFVDRYGPAHDRAACVAEQQRRVDQGLELLDPRVLSDKYVAYISVGGAFTPNWVSLGLPGMYLFGVSTTMKTVGQIDAYNMGRIGSPLLNRELMDQTAALGKHLVASVGKSEVEIEWFGEEGACPVCHNKLITITGQATEVECPMCGILGRLDIADGKIQVTFSEAEKQRARGTYNGLLEHYLEIRGMKDHALPKIQANKEFLDLEMKKYEQFQSTY